MPSLITTSGSATANSFVTQTEADTYCDTRLNADAWNVTASDDDKARALISATNVISNLAWVGDRASKTQRLNWPRAWAPDPDVPTLLLDPTTYIPIGPMPVAFFDVTVIPQRVKDATMELAFQFIVAGTTDLLSIDPTIAVLRERVDVIETEYAAPQQRAQGLARFPWILERIGKLLNPAESGIAVVRT